MTMDHKGNQGLDRQVAKITGRAKWEDRKEDEHRGIRTVLGLTGDRHIDNAIVDHMKAFLVESCKIRENNN